MRDCLRSHDGSITTSFDSLGNTFNAFTKFTISLPLTPKETILSNLCLVDMWFSVNSYYTASILPGGEVPLMRLDVVCLLCKNLLEPQSKQALTKPLF